MPVDRDEEQIRELVSTWMSAAKAGDVDTVLSLMSDEVVFLMPGRRVMHTPEFAAAAQAQAGPGPLQFEGTATFKK